MAEYLPMYLTIAKEIQGKIENKEFISNSKLPSEQELMAHYDVSRITIRKAINELVQGQYVDKIHGKGTYVKNISIQRKITHSSVIGFSKSVEMNGYKSKSIVTHQEVISNKTIAKYLGLSEDAAILYIQRIRYANQEPVMIENNYYDNQKYKDLVNKDLTKSLYTVLENDYNIKEFSSISTSLEISLASTEQANQLGLIIGSPLFLMKTCIIDENKEPIHYGEQYIVGDKYKFEF
ncbi:GntR family transcriptional regulator [Erysipelothrix urinaevulpis]|uniref:GntR family transcriptional regulator n=1 Tax=Erysipelothrix urinaevulpis TaxID=2683717 RepID=UPI00135822D1|nr:GntR family transcriptional regulator [Erysipelothrix urinaevulpis]